MQGRRVLVVDDDAHLCELIRIIFDEAGAEVHTAANGPDGLRLFNKCRPHLVLLDIMMPGMDGRKLGTILRQLSNVPIIFLTALGRETDVVEGLDLGAVDYVVKPFSSKILLARARAALRQAETVRVPEKPSVYDDGYLTIIPESNQVLVRGQAVDLTSTEYRILAYLYQHADRVLTYEQILTAVWGWEYRAATNYVHVYLRHLRQKLEPNPSRPVYLVTERGLGYRFARQATGR